MMLEEKVFGVTIYSDFKGQGVNSAILKGEGSLLPSNYDRISLWKCKTCGIQAPH